jgi:hypothetical protein
MKELWTAQVEVLTPPSVSGCGNTKCFTNVVAWATNQDDYAASVSRLMEKSLCSVLRVQKCVRVEDCTEIPEDHLRQIERAKAHPEDCVVGTLFYYPSKPS